MKNLFKFFEKFYHPGCPNLRDKAEQAPIFLEKSLFQTIGTTAFDIMLIGAVESLTKEQLFKLLLEANNRLVMYEVNETLDYFNSQNISASGLGWLHDTHNEQLTIGGHSDIR